MSLPKHRSLLNFCSRADPRRRSPLQVVTLLFFYFKKRVLFLPPTSATESLQVSVAIKGIWMSQRRLLAQRSDGNTRKHGFQVKKLRMAPSPPRCCCLRRKEQPACVKFPLELQCDCGSNRAGTPGGAVCLLYPAPKGPEHLCLLLLRQTTLKVSDWLASFALVSASVLQLVQGGLGGVRFCFTEWRGRVRRI